LASFSGEKIVGRKKLQVLIKGYKKRRKFYKAFDQGCRFPFQEGFSTNRQIT